LDALAAPESNPKPEELAGADFLVEEPEKLNEDGLLAVPAEYVFPLPLLPPEVLPPEE
jgi:hypothetical protein